MDMRMQLQCFASCQPGTPQTETLMVQHVSFLCETLRHPATSFQTTQTCGEILQKHDSLPALRQPCGLVRRSFLAVLHDLVQRDSLMLNPMPDAEQRRQGNWRSVESPTNTPLPAFNTSSQRLFLGKAEQRKTAYLPKILGEHIVCLRISCLEGHLRRRSILQGWFFCVSIFPGGSTRSQSTQDIVIVCERWPALIMVVARAERQELVWYIRREPVPPLHLLFIQCYHTCK